MKMFTIKAICRKYSKKKETSYIPVVYVLFSIPFRIIFFKTHSFNHFLPLIPLGLSGGALAYLSILGRRQGTPWTTCQFIEGLT